MAALKLLKELLQGSPGALRKLEKLMDEAPRTIELYQNRPLASALKTAASDFDPSGLAIMNPDDFRKLAAPIEGDYMLENVTPRKVESLQAILRGDPKPNDLYSGDGIDYFAPGRIKTKSDPGFEDVQFLQFERPEANVAQVIGHEGRHRSRALADLGDLDTLVRVEPKYKEYADIIPELSEPGTEVFQQNTGEYRGLAENLFRVLGIGGLSALPMLEE
jgi:hypothetical protein